MGERNPHNGETVSVMDMHDFPVTVTEHEPTSRGMKLVTIDPDTERDLLLFDGSPEAVRFVGQDPEEA